MSTVEVRGRATLDGRGWKNTLDQMGGQTQRFATDQLGAVKNAIAGAFAVGALVSFGKDIVDYGSKINDLSKRVGMTAEEFQELAGAAQLAGASEETVVSFLEKVAIARQKALGGGEEGAKLTEQFGKLGVSREDLQLNGSRKLVSQIGEAIKQGDIEQLIAPLRDVGGKSAGELVSAFKDGIDEGAQTIRDRGGVISNENIAALDMAGDEIDLLSKQLKAEFAPAVVWVADRIRGLVDLLSILGTYFGALSESFDFQAAADSVRSKKKEIQERENATVLAFQESQRRRKSIEAGGADLKSESKESEKTKKIYEEIAQIRERAALIGMSAEERRTFLLERQASAIREIEKSDAIKSQAAKDVSDELERQIKAQRDIAGEGAYSTSKAGGKVLANANNRIKELQDALKEIQSATPETIGGVLKRLADTSMLGAQTDMQRAEASKDAAKSGLDALSSGSQKGNIPSDSLLQVGNFLGSSGADNIAALAKDQLSESRRHTEILKDIRDKVSAGTSPDADPLSSHVP